MKRTDRGFDIYGEYKDSYGCLVRIQESSVAAKHCVWIFTVDSLGVNASPHLTKSQARRVAKALLKFADGE